MGLHEHDAYKRLRNAVKSGTKTKDKRKEMANKSTIKQDAFVAKVAKHPTRSLLFKGFVGKAKQAGYTRIYSDAELTDYVDVPTNAILHSQPASAQDSPLGGSYLWVKSEAIINHGPAYNGDMKAFMEGPIYQDYKKQMEAASKGEGGAGVTRFGCPGRLPTHQIRPGAVTPGPGPTTICH
jgi:hypothetical protein